MIQVGHKGRKFELDALDGILLLRALQALTGVVERSEQAVTDIVAALTKAQKGEEQGADRSVLFLPIVKLITNLKEDDLLKLASALFGFTDEAEGIAYFKGVGIELGALFKALSINIDMVMDLIESLGFFKVTATETTETTEPKPKKAK